MNWGRNNLLLQLSIKNFAIFRDTIIDFNNGFSVITGESGAGKSVFITALSLINGERAYKEYIRKGFDNSTVEAVFQVNPNQKERLKEEFDIELDDNLLVITRQFFLDAGSVCKINGKVRSLSLLKDLSNQLCDIHGQYENQTLLNPQTHIEILDNLYEKEIEPFISDYQNNLKEYNDLVEFVMKNSGSEKERSMRMDLLAYQVDEIEKSKVETFNLEALEEERKLQENAEKYLLLLEEAINNLEGEDEVEKIYISATTLSKIKNVKEIEDISESLLSSYYLIKESLSLLKDNLSKFDYNEEEYNYIITRLETFRKLSYKYGSSIEDILEFKDKAAKELYELENFESIYEDKLNRIDKLGNILLEKAEALNNKRLELAEKFSKNVEEILNSLEMPDSVFKVHFENNLHKNKLGYYSFPAKGIYSLEFFISANKGIDTLPLSKIASGGEISRIMLAIKSIIAKKDPTTTYIFDEIDAGISGQAAVVSAIRLFELAKEKQVIAISHLPQIAAKASHQYLIYKNSEYDISYADIKYLDKEERIYQLAVLIEGKGVTETGLNHAKNLINKMKISDWQVPWLCYNT